MDTICDAALQIIGDLPLDCTVSCTDLLLVGEIANLLSIQVVICVPLL